MIKIMGWMFCILLFTPSVSVGGIDEAAARRVEYLRAALSLDIQQAEEFEEVFDQIARSSQERRSAVRGESRERGGSGRGRSGGSSGGGGQDLYAQGEQRAEETRATIAGILREDQSGLYRRMAEQEREWWLDPQLMNMDGMLELSLDQCRHIHPVLRRSRIRLRTLQQNARESGDYSDMEKVRKELEEANEVVLEFLDDRQQEIWEEHIEALKKELEATQAQRNGGGRGGRGGGKGGGRY